MDDRPGNGAQAFRVAQELAVDFEEPAMENVVALDARKGELVVIGRGIAFAVVIG